MVDALREGIELQSAGARARLGAASVQLGRHATQATFVVEGLPDDAESVDAHIDAWSVRGGQNNVFRIVRGSADGHVVLKEENGFRGTASVEAHPLATPFAPSAPCTKRASFADLSTPTPSSRSRSPGWPVLLLFAGAALTSAAAWRSVLRPESTTARP